MERIINPKTKKYIYINGPTYNKLIEEGYSASYLNSLKKVENLQLNLITTQLITYNDDIILILIRYLQLNELFAFYHTSKQFIRLINNNLFIIELNKNFRVKADNFMNLIHLIIYNKHKYNMHDLYKEPPGRVYWWYNSNIIENFNVLYNQYNKGNLLNNTIMVRTSRHSQKNILCGVKKNMIKNYAKELNKLSSSKNIIEYKKNLIRLEYAIYYNLLREI